MLERMSSKARITAAGVGLGFFATIGVNLENSATLTPPQLAAEAAIFSLAAIGCLDTIADIRKKRTDNSDSNSPIIGYQDGHPVIEGEATDSGVVEYLDDEAPNHQAN